MFIAVDQWLKIVEEVAQTYDGATLLDLVSVETVETGGREWPGFPKNNLVVRYHRAAFYAAWYFSEFDMRRCSLLQ